MLMMKNKTRATPNTAAAVLVAMSKNSIFFQDFSVRIPSSKLEEAEDATKQQSKRSSYADNYRMHMEPLSLQTSSAAINTNEGMNTQALSLSAVDSISTSCVGQQRSSEFIRPLHNRKQKEERRTIFNLESLYEYKKGSSIDFGFADAPPEVPIVHKDDQGSPLRSTPATFTNDSDEEMDFIAPPIRYDPTKFYFVCPTDPAQMLGEGRFSQVFKGLFYVPSSDSIISKSFDCLSISKTSMQTVAKRKASVVLETIPFRDCAVKRIHNDPECIEFAMEELEILKAVSGSPFVIQVFALVDEKSLDSSDSFPVPPLHSIPITIHDQSCKTPRWNILLELMEMGDLWTFLERNADACTFELFNKWAYQVASAVDFIHSMGFVHHDLKPQNILINESLDVKVGDFGHARQIPRDGILIDGLGRGTNTFLAPEVLTSIKYTPSIDVFAYGATLFSLISLHQPFYRVSNPVQLLLLVKKGFFESNMNDWPIESNFERPCYFHTSIMVDEQLMKFVERCVSKNPLDRPLPSDLVEFFSLRL